jgi:hypothetical protein
VGEYLAELLSPANRPRSVSTTCEPRAGVCVRSSEASRPRIRIPESIDAPPLAR